jgi:hypothetical protein
VRLSWEEEVQDLGVGEGSAINFSARLIADPVGEFRTVAQIASSKGPSNNDDVATSDLVLSTSSNGTTANLAARIVVKSTGAVRYIPMDTPATAEEGDVYFDSTSKKLRCFNGTAWNNLF